MRFFLRLLREGSGRILILIDWLFKPSVVKRSDEEQVKVDLETKTLKLYQFYACPFCVKTRRAIKRLNLKVETRNAQAAGEFRKELELSGGKIKVPCLKVEVAGEASWIYESNDIINTQIIYFFFKMFNFIVDSFIKFNCFYRLQFIIFNFTNIFTRTAAGF